MDIIGNDNWVAVPDEKGIFRKLEFLKKGSILTTNYDQIKVLNNLENNVIDYATEKAICTELSKPVYDKFLSTELKQTVISVKETNSLK